MVLINIHFFNIGYTLVSTLFVLRCRVHEPAEPVDDLLMPVDAVVRVHHPVVLLGVADEARLDAVALQSGERGEARHVGDAVVCRPVDDQLRGLHVRGEAGGVVLEVRLWRRDVGRSAQELRLDKVQLVGVVVERVDVEHAVVADQTLEAVGLRVQPVDHVATVAGAETADVGRVDPVVFLAESVDEHHEVEVRLASPVADDGFAELIAERAAAVNVGLDNRVAGACERLDVPAVVEVVFPRRLWATVDQKQQRVFLAFFEAVGLEEEGLDVVAIRALVGQVDRLGHGKLGHHLVVVVRKSRHCAVGHGHVNLRRDLERRLSEEQAFLVLVVQARDSVESGGQMLAVNKLSSLFRDVVFKDLLLSLVDGKEVDVLLVAAPFHRAEVHFPIFADAECCFSCVDIVDAQASSEW